MEKSAEKNVLFLVFAGVILILANTAIVMGVQRGQVAPIDNMTLWGAFAVLNICSLLWAVSLLGLQPMVVAISYVTGGLLAYQGVRLNPEVNVAEIATAGATYSAFGALLVGNATAKVRLVFFAKRQVPFVFILLSLLVVDGLLNSRISNADWQIISTAVVYPFLFSGVVVGLAWMLVDRIRADQPSFRRGAEEATEQQAEVVAEADETAQLVFSVPDGAVAEQEDLEEERVAVPDPLSEPAEEGDLPDPVVAEMDTVWDEDTVPDTFFPLEIDSTEDAPLEENPELLGIAALVADHSVQAVEALDSDPVDTDPAEVTVRIEEPVELETVDTDTVVTAEEPVELEIVDTDTVVTAEEPVEVETVDTDAVETVEEPDLNKEGKAEAGDWLNGHLDLLNKLK